MVDLLEGMYAFAVWDVRREELLLARDRFGEKPLFYTEQHGDLLFASELDALLAGIDREPELDPASVDAFFVFGYVPGPASIVRGVKQLPPGHVLRWERRSRRVHVDPLLEPRGRASFGLRRGGRRPPARARERLLRGLARPSRGGPARGGASWRDPRRQRRSLAAARIRAVVGPQARPGHVLSLFSFDHSIPGRGHAWPVGRH